MGAIPTVLPVQLYPLHQLIYPRPVPEAERRDGALALSDLRLTPSLINRLVGNWVVGYSFFLCTAVCTVNTIHQTTESTMSDWAPHFEHSVPYWAWVIASLGRGQKHTPSVALATNHIGSTAQYSLRSPGPPAVILASYRRNQSARGPGPCGYSAGPILHTTTLVLACGR
jgi:hypothetical protein